MKMIFTVVQIAMERKKEKEYTQTKPLTVKTNCHQALIGGRLEVKPILASLMLWLTNGVTHD